MEATRAALLGRQGSQPLADLLEALVRAVLAKLQAISVYSWVSALDGRLLRLSSVEPTRTSVTGSPTSARGSRSGRTVAGLAPRHQAEWHGGQPDVPAFWAKYR